MTLTASDANELSRDCDNNTVKTHHDNRSDFLRTLGFLDKIFSKKPILFICNKVYKDLKGNKAK